jgi:hypothetical protein
MYPLGQNINNTIESRPTEVYSSKDLLELDNVAEYCQGLLKRIITPSSGSGFCEFLH